MRALCLSLLLLSATLLTAVPAPAANAAIPEPQRALIVHALKAGACQPEGDGRVICVLSVVLIDGVLTTRPVARETPRQAFYVTVTAVPTPGGVLVLSANGHQERWTGDGERLTLSMVFVDLLDPASATYGEVITFVRGTEVETSQGFTPSSAEIQSTLQLLRVWFLAPRDLI